MSQNQTSKKQLFKNIHIGSLIKKLMIERNVSSDRACIFLNCTKSELLNMYDSESINTDVLLKLSKLLEYDFFRIFSHHLILYAPPSSQTPEKETKLPKFRKNLYTQGIIDFILEQLRTGEKSKSDIIEEYRIPKTTLYKWITKHETN